MTKKELITKYKQLDSAVDSLYSRIKQLESDCVIMVGEGPDPLVGYPRSYAILQGRDIKIRDIVKEMLNHLGLSVETVEAKPSSVVLKPNKEEQP